jgi:hypothetical protein
LPRLQRVTIAVFAGNHGVAARACRLTRRRSPNR